MNTSLEDSMSIRTLGFDRLILTFLDTHTTITSSDLEQVLLEETEDLTGFQTGLGINSILQKVMGHQGSGDGPMSAGQGAGCCCPSIQGLCSSVRRARAWNPCGKTACTDPHAHLPLTPATHSCPTLRSAPTKTDTP